MAANLFLDLCLKLAGIFIWTIDISSDPLLDLAGNLSTLVHTWQQLKETVDLIFSRLKAYWTENNLFITMTMNEKQDHLSGICGGPKKGLFGFCLCGHSLLGAGVLGDGLGALRDGVLGQLSGQQEPDGGLDLPGGDGGPLVVVGELAGLGGDPLEDVIDEGVHDAHGLGRDSGVGINLLQDFVDVDGVGFFPLLPLGSLLTASLLGLVRASVRLPGHLDVLSLWLLGWHGCSWCW